jgi:hypothetical protein
MKEIKRAEVFKTGHALVMRGEHLKAAEVLGEALKTFPNDESLMSELALALAQDSDLITLENRFAVHSGAFRKSDGKKYAIPPVQRCALFT